MTNNPTPEDIDRANKFVARYARILAKITAKARRGEITPNQARRYSWLLQRAAKPQLDPLPWHHEHTGIHYGPLTSHRNPHTGEFR